MLSPIDRKTGLVTIELEPGLNAMSCPASGGLWLRPSAFWKWRESQPDPTPLGPVDDGQDLAPGNDSPAGKRCPEDGAFLIRHRVGHGLYFHLDRCGHCGGIWFDRDEWEAVKQRGLTRDLHLIFTSAWQAEVRRQEAIDRQHGRLAERLGTETFEKLKGVRGWIDSHPRRGELLAYLKGDNDV